MNYYKLKFVNTLPDGFGGKANRYKVEILKKYRSDQGLLAHELIHVKAWYVGLAVCLLVGLAAAGYWHWLWIVPAAAVAWSNQDIAYRWKWYRKWIEVVAYRKQLSVGYGNGIMYLTADFAVNALMSKYGLSLSREEAEELLG